MRRRFTSRMGREWGMDSMKRSAGMMGRSALKVEGERRRRKAAASLDVVWCGGCGGFGIGCFFFP